MNAFTDYAMTGYYFSCTEHFDDCLRLLLRMVTTPDFPRAAMASEREVIADEIALYADSPADCAQERLYRALYRRHPIRTPITGTRTSIRRVTPEVLQLCFDAFYRPDNMALIVMGDVDAERVAELARACTLEASSAKVLREPFLQEDPGVFRRRTVRHAAVSLPSFSIGFRAEPGEDLIHQAAVGTLAAELLLGESSALYETLYEASLIDADFSACFTQVPGAALLQAGGTGRRPDAVLAAILRGAEQALAQGFDPAASRGCRSPPAAGSSGSLTDRNRPAIVYAKRISQARAASTSSRPCRPLRCGRRKLPAPDGHTRPRGDQHRLPRQIRRNVSMFLASPITFPNLGITVDPSPVAFTVFGKDIYWYGIIIASGFLLAVLYMLHRAKDFGVTQDDVLDMILWAVPIGVVCARLYYCIFYWELYEDDPISMLYIWEGGLAIYGGIIGGVITLLVVSKVKKIPAPVLLDLAGMGVIIGQCIGRWGNFMNREAHGAVTEAFLKMGLQDAAGVVTYYHPTFLYESVWNLIGFIGLHLFSKKRKFDGEIFLLYVAWYGLGRAWIEGLRTDSLYLFSTGIRVSQLVAALSFLAAAGSSPGSCSKEARAGRALCQPEARRA